MATDRTFVRLIDGAVCNVAEDAEPPPHSVALEELPAKYAGLLARIANAHALKQAAQDENDELLQRIADLEDQLADAESGY
jgi:hypothetical protein